MNPGFSTVFGGGHQDSESMITFKRVGFTLTIAFLVLTIISHCIVKESHANLGGKMIIGMTLTMIGLYSCLLARTRLDMEYTQTLDILDIPFCVGLGNNLYKRFYIFFSMVFLNFQLVSPISSNCLRLHGCAL